MEKMVIAFTASNGKQPFNVWLHRLDNKARDIIMKRVDRMGKGHYGDYKPLGDGIYELKFKFGPGYRVYFGEDGRTNVVLLGGGCKGSQASDIKRAKMHWQQC